MEHSEELSSNASIYQEEGKQALAAYEKANLAIKSGDRILLESVAEHCSTEETGVILNQLNRINSLEQNTVANLRRRHELSENDEKRYRQLQRYSINADGLTPPEMTKLLDYATDRTDEIRNEKIERIYGAFVKHVNSVRSRHDGYEPAYYNPEEAARKDEIRDKYLAYQRGELDTERGFDVQQVYERLIREGYEESDAMRRHLEEDDLETLLDEGLIDEGDLFIYGPFSAEDIEDAKVFELSTWTDITNFRYIKHFKLKTGGSLSNLLNDTIMARASSVETDLLYDYVASEMLQSRRLKAKELSMAASSLALDVLEIGGADGKQSEQFLEGMRRSASWMGYYLGKIFDRSSDEMRNRFGSNRPLSKDYFEEILGEARNVSDSRAEYLDDSFKPFLTKLDEHMHNLLNYMAASKETTSIMDEMIEEYD